MWCIIKYFEIITFTLLLKIKAKHVLTSGNEVFLVTKDYCVTNSEYAIAFNPSEEADNTVSKFYSTSNTSLNTNYDCTACTEQYWRTNFWNLTNSIEGEIKEELTDRRWEDLPLYRTQHLSEGSDNILDFKDVFRSEYIGNDFVVSISIRIENNAHIFLCEDYVTNSKCYWIMLQAWQGNTSAIRKCDVEFISEKDNEYPGGTCKELRDSYNHTSTDNILDSTIWNHFTIVRQSGTITVLVRGRAQPLLKYRDNNDLISPKRIFFHGKNHVGFWKLHKYSYIYSSVEDQTFLPWGPEFKFQAGVHCLALFIVMCSNCTMNITLATRKDDVFTDELKTENEKWKEFKIIFKTESTGDVVLYIYRHISGTHLKPFWAINNIRQCGENEYRILKSTTEYAPCQIVANTTLISATVQNTLNESTSKCADDTFGTSCIPCSIFEKTKTYCDSFKYCELFNGKNICSCSSGYESDHCDKPCSERHYGHSCKKICKYCADGCYNINGWCINKKCIEDFTGDKCDQHRLPLLIHAPEVINITSSSCKVLQNTEFIGNEEPEFYRIQYKENTSNTWMELPRQYFSHISNYRNEINSLEADSRYCVRVLLYTNDEQVYNGNAVEEHCFITTCTPYSTYEIDIQTTNISAMVKLRNYNWYKCKISNYRYSIDDKEQYQMENMLNIPNLNPIQKYVFHLHHPAHESISVNFTTKEGVPSKVKNLKANSSSNNIFLSWEEPEVTRGKVKYIIKYAHLRSLGCSPSNRKKYYETVYPSKTEQQLFNLKPYSEYEVKIGAQTTWKFWEYSIIIVETNASEYLTENEFPEIKSKNTSTNESMFEMSVKCDRILGPIYLKFEAKCQSTWCEQEIHNTYIATYNKTFSAYSINNLSSYTDYRVDIKASRNKNVWLNMATEDISTKPSVPNKINNMSVTSKDENSISFRWIPPFPPTGVLAGYKIKYNDFKHMQDIEQCRLWPDYHCATIAKDIKDSEWYNIQLFAANEDPADYVRISKLDGVRAVVEKPQPPYDVAGTWTETDNFLVSWKHPNVTNGKVEKFVVKIEKGPSFIKHIDSEKDYNLTYKYSINQTYFKFCANMNVSIIVHNKKYEAKSATIHTNSPPPAPCITDGAIKITNGTDNTFNVKISNIYKENSVHFVKDIYILISSEKNKKIVAKDLRILKTTLKNTTEIPDLKTVTIIKHFKEEEIPFDTNIPISSSIGDDKGKRLYILFISKCKKRIRIQICEKDMSHFDEEDIDKGIYALLLLLLLIPLATYLYIYKFKKTQASKGTLLSILQQKRNKDVEEVPLSEPVANKIKPPTVPKPVSSASRSSVYIPTFSKPIKIVDFEMYVKQSIENGELENQHEKFPRGQTKPWEYGALKVNKSKNRYNNLVAYDHTRVKLTKIEGNEYSDYINANYIDGYRMPRAYIATQGPKPTTLNDFWRMVWQEKVKHIVMLANIHEGGKKKVEKYWPNINEDKDFNGIKVQYLSSKVYANYEHRVFKVSCKNQHREVTQLHFTSWPDHGVPLYPQSLVPFLQQILKIPNNPQSPIIVHCSAGVGRTGTIILCDVCLRMAAGEGSIDFLGNLEYLRSQRPNMVDNVEQYKLAHLVVLDCLFGMHTSIPCDENMHKTVKTILESDAIFNQIKYVDETEWQDRAMDTIFDKDEMPLYLEKNRFQHILPDKNYRVCLGFYPYNDESSAYINAVQVDGFRNPGRFIVTQQPLPNTLGDFWRMVWERQCTVIISLNEIDPKDKSSCPFWPRKGVDLTPVDYLTISCVKVKVLEFYQIVTLQAINRKENESMEINIIVMHDWKPNEILPSSTEKFLFFCEECDILTRNCDTVVVTCYDGTTASGLFIAATFLIDKMKLEQECDVCLAVRTIRHNRKEFVSSKEQFTFLYEVGVKYIDSFQSYSNFA